MGLEDHGPLIMGLETGDDGMEEEEVGEADIIKIWFLSTGNRIRLVLSILLENLSLSRAFSSHLPFLAFLYANDQ
jgi:hypothetical protein